MSLSRGSYSLVNSTSVWPPYLCCSTFMKQQLTGMVKFLIKSARNTKASSSTPTTVRSPAGRLVHISPARALIRLCMSCSDHTMRILLSIWFLEDLPARLGYSSVALRIARERVSRLTANSTEGGIPGDQTYRQSRVKARGQDARRLTGILWLIINFFNLFTPAWPITPALSPGRRDLMIRVSGTSESSKTAIVQSRPSRTLCDLALLTISSNIVNGTPLSSDIKNPAAITALLLPVSSISPGGGSSVCLSITSRSRSRQTLT